MHKNHSRSKPTINPNYGFYAERCVPYEKNVNHFKTIADYCKAIGIPQPKHPHFDIRSFEENMPTIVHTMSPFRHEFYAIAIKTGGGGKAVSGHHTDFPEGAIVFFNSPFQILSWDIVPNWKGYYIMFTQDFIAKAIHFSQLLEEFPFLRIDNSIPFEVEGKDMDILITAYRIIWTEYHSDNPDKFHLIEAYMLLLLNYIKRYFSKQMDDGEAEKQLRAADLKLLSRYQTLIQTSFYPDTEIDASSNVHSTSYYAHKLNVHPNHLNAVVKEITGHTALNQIHNHLLQLAKSHLAQTGMSVKEIAYNLHFDSPNSFSAFFKKNTNLSALAYRKKAIL